MNLRTWSYFLSPLQWDFDSLGAIWNISIGACRSNVLLLCQDLKIQIIHRGNLLKILGIILSNLHSYLRILPSPCLVLAFENEILKILLQHTLWKLPSHFTRKIQKFCWFKHWLNFHNIRLAFKEVIKESVNSSLSGLWKQNPIKPLYLLIFVLIKLLWVLLAVYTMKIWRSSMIIFIFVFIYFIIINTRENLLESLQYRNQRIVFKRREGNYLHF